MGPVAPSRTNSGGAKASALDRLSWQIGGKLDAIVVGAGLVGVTAALALQQRGMRVTLLDQQAVAQSCSLVSGGVIYPGAFPSAAYYRIPEYPAAFVRASSSAALDWRSAPRLLCWGYKYAKATSSDMVWHGTDLLHELCRYSLRSFESLLGADLPPISTGGYLSLHLSPAEAERAAYMNLIRTSFGAAARTVSGAELVALEPSMCGIAIGRDPSAGTFLPGGAHVTDSARFLADLVEVFVERGGRLAIDRAYRLESKPCGDVTVFGSRSEYSAQVVVLATGAHSNQLLVGCGHRIPLIAQRGYDVELDVAPGFINRPVSLPSLGVVLTPSQRGARISGISHFGLPGFRPRPGLLHAALNRVREVLPLLRVRPSFEVRSGERPTTPDSLPVIERVPGHRSIFVSTGHGHLGMTLAAVSADIVADLVTKGASNYASELSSQRFVKRIRSQAYLRAA